MTRTRIASALAATAAALLLAGPAQAAPLKSNLTKTLTATKSAKDRHALGLPGYAEILGRRWKAKVRKADAALVKRLVPPVRAAAAADPLKAADVLKRGKERQKRRVRIATAVHSLCPEFSPDPQYATEIKVTGRAEEVIATVERVRGYEITTIVTLDARVESSAPTHGDATLGDIVADNGTFSIVRQQTARNLRTGRVRPTGPTQRLEGTLSPLFHIEADWEAFIDRYGDEDEAPAPRRELRGDVWEDVGQAWVRMLYSALEPDYAKAVAHFRTPNACVTLDVPAPERLAPGQTVQLTGVPTPRFTTTTQQHILASARISAELYNLQGQEAHSPATYPLDPGEVWTDFTAPPQKWPDDRPVGIEFTVTTEGGIATRQVEFKPAGGFPVHYKVLSASFDTSVAGTASDSYCGTVGGTREFSGGGAPSAAASEPKLELGPLGDVDGTVFTRVAASWHDVTTTGCGERRAPCTYAAPNTSPLPDGRTAIGFSVSAPSASASESATLLWSVPSPEIGFIDAGDEECNASFHQAVPFEKLVTKVPLSQLLSPAPQTYKLTGTQHYTQTSEGDAASFDYTWSYTITIQPES